MVALDESKRSKRGPAPLSDDARRSHSVTTRVNQEELAQLDAQRVPVRMHRGEYLRAAALHRLPPVIPEINRQAWVALARSAANLNQIAHRCNADDLPQLDEIRRVLSEFRCDLIGAKHASGEQK